MKKIAIITILCFLAASLLTITGCLKTPPTPDKRRVGIGALQGGGNANMPEYIRVFQIPSYRQEFQWATVEDKQGVYDFSFLEESLKNIKAMNRKAIIKLNANDKPEWLFDFVPYHPSKLGGAIDDTLGTLMYWHPNYVDAYEKLLIAFGKYLKTTPYRDIITGIRMSFNAVGVEHTKIAKSQWPLDKWIIPPGCDPQTVQTFTPETPDKYKETVVGFHVEHILPYAYVWMRTNIPEAVLEKFRSYVETGKLGFFHTGASMEQNQIYFGDKHRYSRFIEFCRSGKTLGFAEVDGYHNYAKKYKPEEVFKMTQFNYWRLLSEMHCGVSLAGMHFEDALFEGSLQKGEALQKYFDMPELDEAWKFTDKYIGLHASPKASPGAWVALRDDTGDQYQGDYTFLMEREGNNPIPPLTDAYPGVDDGSIGKRKVGSELVRFGAWARGLPSGKSMIFHVDPRVFSKGEKRIARVVYFDEGSGRWELKQNGVVKISVSNNNTGYWVEKEILIDSDGNDYQIENTGSEELIFHMLEIKRTNEG